VKTSRAGLDLIKEFEGCRLEAYQDVAGVWTIGIGSTENVHPGLTITPEQAEQRLVNHLAPLEVQVCRLVRVPLTQNQFDALISFCYNVGVGHFEGSLLLKCLNSHQDAASEFLKWSRAGGVEVPGLLRRREAERELFLRG
jgi:lysozyme